MAALKKNLYIECGTDSVVLRFRMKNKDGTYVDLTGCKARAQIKASTGATAALITFSTDDNSIVIDNINHTIDLVTTPVLTNNIKATKGVWDFEFVDSLGKVTRIFEGSVTFSPQVTTVDNT